MIVDCDMHVMEPPDLWSKAGLPIEGWGWNGLVVDGVRVPDAPSEWPTDDEAYQGGPGAIVREAATSGFGWSSTVDACDREGIDVAVLFPTRGLGLVGVDADLNLAARGCMVYNEWVAAYCAAARDAGRHKLLAVGLLSLADPARACTLAYCAKDLGLVGVVARPNPIEGRTLSHPDLDRFYSALAGLGLPLILHEGTGAHLDTLGLDRSLTYLAAHAMSHPFEQMAAVLEMTVGGVFDRHPALRVGFFESGAGWVPWWLDRLDDHALGLFGAREYCLDRRPSFYFRRQGFVTMEPGEELHGIKGTPLEGNVVFASDYPHGDSHYPHAVRTAKRSSGGLWGHVSHRNAERLFFRP